MRLRTLLGMALLPFGLAGCLSIPEGLDAVQPFQPERYMGKWYEIARLDHRFERGLDQVTAEYRLQDNGNIEVINRGYNTAEGKWEEARGKAKLIEPSEAGAAQSGRLKVSFFGPFYASYNIISLDSEYQESVVTGPDRSYLWILARTPALPDSRLDELKRWLQDRGFAAGNLIYPEH